MVKRNETEAEKVTSSPATKDKENEETNRSRKRVRCKSEWKRNIAKRRLNSGESYTNSKGRQLEARKVQPPCRKCRLKCSDKISEEERLKINNAFWGMGNINQQREFIVRHTKKIEPKYRYVRTGSTRSKNFSFHFQIHNTNVRVCKQMFLGTLSVSNRYLQTSWSKMSEEGAISIDMRGKHNNRKRLDEQVEMEIREHIMSFDRVESHYCRSRTNREYLDGSLNISLMYELYKAKCLETGKQFAKKHHYYSVFNTFNISFHQPKKDQCSLCTNYRQRSGVERDILQTEYDNHMKAKEKCREEKKTDVAACQTDDTSSVCCFDLQAVLPVPCGECSSLYYKRKLSCYNFTIFDIVNKEGTCFYWHEAIAKRGANEISSCLLKFIGTMDASGKTNLTFYADNCIGQNKNKHIVSLYLHVLQNMDNIESITQKYFIKGHTQNENDSVHATIEREKKRVLKGGPITHPSQWVPVIKLAKKNGNPYKVVEMDTADIFDFRIVADSIGRNYSMNEDGEKVVWADIKVLHFVKQEPYRFFYKTSFEEQEYKCVSVRARQRRTHPQVELRLAYDSPPTIDFNKKKDLVSLCNEYVIPSVYWDFYRTLKHENVKENIEQDECCET